jgi:hypothetical protein
MRIHGAVYLVIQSGSCYALIATKAQVIISISNCHGPFDVTQRLAKRP